MYAHTIVDTRNLSLRVRRTTRDAKNARCISSGSASIFIYYAKGRGGKKKNPPVAQEGRRGRARSATRRTSGRLGEGCCGRDAETPTATRLCGDADKSQKRTSRFFARTHIKANFELQRRYNKVYTLYGTHDGTLPFRKPVNNCALMRSYSPLITHQYSATSKMFMS